MNARIANVLSRLSIVSVVAVSSVGLAACAKAPETDATREAPAAVQTEATAEHGPGRQVFAEIQGLDLREAQRDALAEIEQNLRADMAPHRETARQIARDLALAIERGELDDATVATHGAAIQVAMSDAHAAIAEAMNQVHDTLDAEQRADLVARLVARHEERKAGRAAGGEGRPQEALARLASTLGLTEEQQRALRDAIQQGGDELFPERKARREQWEAKMKRLAEAFVRDDFSAEDHELGGHAEEVIAKASAVAQRAVDVSGTILGAGQRRLLADMIRERADRR